MFIIQVVIIGILLVFLILLLLTLILMVFPKLVNAKKNNSVKEKQQDSPTQKSVPVVNQAPVPEQDYTLISIITAAIAAYRSENGENTDIGSFRVVAFKRATNRK